MYCSSYKTFFQEFVVAHTISQQSVLLDAEYFVTTIILNKSKLIVN